MTQQHFDGMPPGSPRADEQHPGAAPGDPGARSGRAAEPSGPGRPSGPSGPSGPGGGVNAETPRTTDGKRAGTPERIPFPTVDEITRHCLTEREPETVHIEIHLPGTPRPDRLRAAVRAALRQHARILVRQTASRWWHRHYWWELTDGPDRDPVSYPSGTLEEARHRAVSDCPPLASSPPIRIEVIEQGEGSVLLAVINHTALDGPACLRVLATAAEHYGQADNAPTPAPVRPSNGDPDGPHPDPSTSPWTRPTRISSDTPHPGASGNGMLVVELPLPARPPRAPDGTAAYTVNDQLLVATWLMSARWNRLHGQPTRPVRITMPVDDRPRTLDMPIGNGTRLVEVTFGAEERELHEALAGGETPDPAAVARMLRTTAARTRALKALRRPQLGFSGRLLTTGLLPVGLRAAYTRTLRGLAGPWASTTLLSNIGRVPYPMDFGEAGRATAVWFSAPARSPRGLSVTTVSTSGRLQLALRWSHSRFHDEAGRSLGELFERALESTAHRPDPGGTD